MNMINTIKHPFSLALVLLSVAFLACRRINDNNPALVGKWQGKEWLISGKPADRNVAQVFFVFSADGSYSAGMGEQSESGVWRTDKDKLYSKGKDREEIMVKFRLPDSLTLVFEMNRSGQQETLTLTKKQ